MSDAVRLPVSPALTEAPVLAHVVRGGVVESVHRGTVVVTAPDGSVDWSLGEPSGVVFPRSANKPLQAVAMVRAGLDLPDRLLALACSSHSGEPFHLQGAADILARAGLTEADLQNTPAFPIDEAEHDAWLRAGRSPSALAQNCSGKHAAMLATCVAAGWECATYRDPDHPLQRHITEVLTELTGEPVAAVAVDGCGAPAHAYALTGLARAFGRLATASQGSDGSAEARVAGAVKAEPLYLGGTHRQVTALVREAGATFGLIAKDGAESVYAVGLGDGRGVAVKIADGNPRAKPVVLAAVLRRLGLDAPLALAELEDAPVLGHGDPVGAVVATGI
ncbi:MAG: asparaginase [Lapillicoccus sp.]